MVTAMVIRRILYNDQCRFRVVLQKEIISLSLFLHGQQNRLNCNLLYCFTSVRQRSTASIQRSVFYVFSFCLNCSDNLLFILAALTISAFPSGRQYARNVYESLSRGYVAEEKLPFATRWDADQQTKTTARGGGDFFSVSQFSPSCSSFTRLHEGLDGGPCNKSLCDPFVQF